MNEPHDYGLMSNKMIAHNKWEQPVFLDKIPQYWFDRWSYYRKHYQTFPFSDFKRLCNDAWKDFQNVFHTTYEFNRFFETIMKIEPVIDTRFLSLALHLDTKINPDIRVFELGGANGYLASDMFERQFPISEWVNCEICDQSRAQPVCKHPAYRSIDLSQYFWDIEDFTELLGNANILIGAHVFEHFPEDLFIKTFTNLHKLSGLKYICMEMPILEDGNQRAWTDSHLLQCGWKQIIADLDRIGYKELYSNRLKDVRSFIRIS